MGRAVPGSLFGLAPDGVYRAPSITLGAVGSYPTFSPLPGKPGGLFSAALAVGDTLKRRLPRVSRPRGTSYAASRPAEFGLSSPGKPKATLRPSGIEEPHQATPALPHKQAAWPSGVDFGKVCRTMGAAAAPLTQKKNMPIEVGNKAPDFTLKSKSTGDVTDVTLSSNFGSKNTVLLFVPLAFTGVCTGELCDITAGLGAYADLNADVIGISVDSPFSQEAWAQKEGIGITLASDLNKSAAADYGVLLDDLMGFGSVSARAAFVIDKDGVVQYSEQTPTPKDLPNFDAIKETLAKLQ